MIFGDSASSVKASFGMRVATVLTAPGDINALVIAQYPVICGVGVPG